MTQIVFDVVLIGLVVHLFIEVKAMQKSTHSIQYVPADSAFQPVTQGVKDAMAKDIFENVE